MVEYASGIISDRSLQWTGKPAPYDEQFLQGKALEGRILLQEILILYMPSTYSVADVLHTYTYRMAFGSQIDYGLATASGLFQSVLGTVLLIISNTLNKKVTGHALY